MDLAIDVRLNSVLYHSEGSRSEERILTKIILPTPIRRYNSL